MDDKSLVEHVGMAINERANKAYNLYMLGKDESMDLATVAINAIAEYINSNKNRSDDIYMPLGEIPEDRYPAGASDELKKWIDDHNRAKT